MSTEVTRLAEEGQAFRATLATLAWENPLDAAYAGQFSDASLGAYSHTRFYHTTLPAFLPSIMEQGITATPPQAFEEKTLAAIIELHDTRDRAYPNALENQYSYSRELQRNDGRVWVSTHRFCSDTYGFPETLGAGLATLYAAAARGGHRADLYKQLADSSLDHLLASGDTVKSLVTIRPAVPALLAATLFKYSPETLDRQIAHDPSRASDYFGDVNIGINAVISPADILDVVTFESKENMRTRIQHPKARNLL